MSAPDDRRRAQWAEARRWFAHVDEDLKTAELCLTGDPPVLGSGAYHCQQAAEKLIKGLLVAAARPFPKIHDLKDLTNRAAPDYPPLVEEMMALRELTVWGYAYRYPFEEEEAAEPPAAAHIRTAVERLRGLLATARSLDPHRES